MSKVKSKMIKALVQAGHDILTMDIPDNTSEIIIHTKNGSVKVFNVPEDPGGPKKTRKIEKHKQ